MGGRIIKSWSFTITQYGTISSCSIRGLKTIQRKLTRTLTTDAIIKMPDCRLSIAKEAKFPCKLKICYSGGNIPING